LNPESFERFFVAYLKEKDLEYSYNDSIYNVKLNKDLTKLYGESILTCTFDSNIARKKKITLMGLGTFIFDTIVGSYTDELLISNLRIAEDPELVYQVSDKLNELDKGSTAYNVNEVKETITYCYFEVTINTVHTKKMIGIPLIILKDQILYASLEEAEFEEAKGVVEINIDRALNEIPIVLQEEIKEAGIQHQKDMLELINIRDEHAQDKYNDISNKENELQDKIETCQDDMISAATFNSKRKLSEKLKSLKTKHLKLTNTNKVKKEKIKLEFDLEKESLKKRELKIEAKLLAYAKIDMPYFIVNYADDTSYYYIPYTNRFFKKK